MQTVHVVPDRHIPHRGMLRAGALWRRCALGRSGVVSAKCEGDGGTPRGILRPLALLYRADRGPRPASTLPTSVIRPDSGWCDDPTDRRYNCPVRLPYAGRHERLWRDDRLYDILVVLDHNMTPPVPGRGSAIFLHLATPDFGPTEGCIAVDKPTLRALLAYLAPASPICVA